MYQDILLIIISFIGLFFGVFLAINSPEEMKPGRKYFYFLEEILLLIIIGLVASTIKFSLVSGLILLGGIVLGSLLKKEYLYFGLIIFSLFASSLWIYLIALIFLYGLPYGTLIKIHYKHYAWLLIENVAFFFLPAIILISPLQEIFTLIGLGGLVGIFIMKN